MVADFINVRLDFGDRLAQQKELLALPQPWGGYAWRELNRTYGADWREAPEAADEFLRRSSVLYPIDAFQWLDRAQIAAAAGDLAGVDQRLAVATDLQPKNRLALWTATQIALASGNERLAERQIRQWLVDHPRDVERGLFVGRRWLDDPGELIDRVLPVGRDYLDAAISVARRQRDLLLARAAWSRLEPEPAFQTPSFLDYIEVLIDSGQLDEASELWQRHDATAIDVGIANGSFDREFGEPYGFNWRVDRVPNGVRIDRDLEEFASEPASLQVRFNGKNNVRLSRPWKRIPVDAGARLELTGKWRAERITTRARPYLLIVAEGARYQTRLDLPRDTFDWTAFRIEIDVPPETRILRFAVRRDSTDDFDRYIDGTLWLDDLALEQRPEIDSEAAADL
jgi:hypothetical protein